MTSDSKLLFMDRNLIKGELTTEGLADNTIGLMLHGRPLDGYFEYSVGLFDNANYEQLGVGTTQSDELMLAGRIEPDWSPGLRVQLREGCDRTVATCAARFDNAVNFQGEPFLPGNDMLAQYPVAR